MRKHNFVMAEALTADKFFELTRTDRKLKKVVEIKGQELEFYMTPLTITESQAVQKMVKSEDANEFAVQLLIKKAMTSGGAKIFDIGQAMQLKGACDKAELDKLLLALVTNDPEEELTDIKSSKG